MLTLRKQTASDMEEPDPVAKEVINQNFYVDDMLRSEDSTAAAIRTIACVEKACRNGGFNLTKFVCMEPAVVNSIPVEKRSGDRVRDLSQAEHVERALGVHWCLDSDTLGFRITLKDTP